MKQPLKGASSAKRYHRSKPRVHGGARSWGKAPPDEIERQADEVSTKQRTWRERCRGVKLRLISAKMSEPRLCKRCGAPEGPHNFYTAPYCEPCCKDVFDEDWENDPGEYSEPEVVNGIAHYRTKAWTALATLAALRANRYSMADCDAAECDGVDCDGVHFACWDADENMIAFDLDDLPDGKNCAGLWAAVLKYLDWILTRN